MANTLGIAIGKVAHSFSTKLDNDEVVQLKLEFDFSTCSDQDIKSWLVSNRVISFQRPARAMKAEALKALDGTVVNANDVGKKVQTPEDKFKAGIAALRSVGMNEQADALEAEWNAKHTN
jgi:hypothetical protein